MLQKVILIGNVWMSANWNRGGRIFPFLSPLEECDSFVRWDDQGKCVCIQDTLPEEFDAEVANHIWFLAEEVSERVNVAIKRLEEERRVKNNNIR